jgi:mannitol-1-phosphate 5-dehydrogenase
MTGNGPRETEHRRRTFVGFGFGPIQAGLFLFEAFRSGSFGHLVAAEVAPDIVDAVRRARRRFSVNIAHPDRIEREEIAGVEIEDPSSRSDQDRLLAAIAEAEEIATAVPSVEFYASPSPGSIHRLLARGLRRKAATQGHTAIVYAAENHNHAAEILEARVLEEVPENEKERVSRRVRFLNTVIGKMNGVVSDPVAIQRQGLAPVTPGSQCAFLVEAFNHILISRIRFPAGGAPPFQRGITVFEEKDDLLPFEEAKLYGHNSTHALAAYLGAMRGVQRIADLRRYPDILSFLRSAFIQESGEALVRKHGGQDRLFTHEGYRQYADDLLARMVNPFLNDIASRGWGAIRSENSAGTTGLWEPSEWRCSRESARPAMHLAPRLRWLCSIVILLRIISRWQTRWTHCGKWPLRINWKKRPSSG